MADQWYYARNKQKHGPLTVQQLKQAAASGELQATDLVWKEGMQKWVPASSIKGLFQAAKLKVVADPAKLAASRPPRNDGDATAQAEAGAGEPGKKARPFQPTRKTFWLIGAAGAGVCAVPLCLVCIAVLGSSRPGKNTPDGGNGQAGQGVSKAGGSTKVVPVMAEVDFSVGPRGQKIVKAERKKRVEQGFGSVNKGVPVSGLFTQHGPFILYYDDANTKKRREGNILAQKWHGKVMAWYENGKPEYERYFDKGIPVGTHMGWDEEGNATWQLTYSPGSRPSMSKLTCEDVILQIVFLHGARQYHFNNKWHYNARVGLLENRDRDEVEVEAFKSLVGEPDEKNGEWSKQTWTYRCKDGKVWMELANMAECPGGGQRNAVILMGPQVYSTGSVPKARK